MEPADRINDPESGTPGVAAGVAEAGTGGTEPIQVPRPDVATGLKADPAVAVFRSMDRAASGFLHEVRRLSIPRPRKPHLRLLPTLMFAALLMLVGRANDFQSGLLDLSQFDAGVPAQAEEAAADEAEPEAHVAAVSDPVEREETATTESTERDGSGIEPDATPAEAEPFDPEALSGSEVELLQALSERRQELEARERRLQEREALLSVAEVRVEEKITELETLRTEIQGFLGAADEQQDVQLASLVRIYEAMRPSDASAIFDGLEMDVLINVLERMSERKSAPIIAGMNPQRAREVTTELALRRRMPTAPDELRAGSE